MFDKLVQVLVLGASCERMADSSCPATTIRNRRDEWIAAGVFTQLEQLCLEAYDKSVGLDLREVTVDGRIVKAPCTGEAAGRSPVDRGKHRAPTLIRIPEFGQRCSSSSLGSVVDGMGQQNARLADDGESTGFVRENGFWHVTRTR